MNLSNEINLKKYIEELEKDLKHSFSLINLLEKKDNTVINEYLKDLIQIIFEDNNINFQKDEDVIKYAIELAKKYIKEENLKKEILFTTNLAFLIYLQFDKEIKKNDFQELDIYASSFFLFLIKEMYENSEKFEKLIKLLDLKFTNKSIIDLYIDFESKNNNLLFSMKEFLNLFDNEDIKITIEEENAKKIDLDDLFYII